MKRSLIVAIGSAAVALTAGAGVASADPMDNLINSTCTYQQAVAAMNSQSPDLAAEFNRQPGAQAMLRSFVKMSPDQRRATVASAAGNPVWEQVKGPIVAAAGICNNF